MAILECPFCFEILEVNPPDKLHTAFSSVQPVARSFHGKVVEERVKCQNPECKKAVTVFWYTPLEYFNRI